MHPKLSHNNMGTIIMSTFMLLLVLINGVNSQEQISFFFNEFMEGGPSLILQGDATVSSNNELQLTRVGNNGVPLANSVGRALHSAPIRLYDKSSGSVAKIWTTFTFETSAPSSSTPADGLAFFFTSLDSTIPPRSHGAFLGLFSAANARNNSRNQLIGFKHSSSHQVVAVEFDTYPNRELGDPNYRHIGVDVNSIRSEATAEWEWPNGQQVAVLINYEPILKQLKVCTFYTDGTRVELITHQLDLTTVLPEWVRVGFSASTGQLSQINKIISWSFDSLLETNKDDVVNIPHIASVV